MPKLSKEKKKEFLEFLGWKKKKGLWLHPEYQEEPGPEPNFEDPASLIWLIDWVMSKDGFQIRFFKSYNQKSDKYYCVIKGPKFQEKWVVSDIPRKAPHLAAVSVLLKMMRFPDGPPRKTDDYLQSLIKEEKKIREEQKIEKEKIKNRKTVDSPKAPDFERKGGAAKKKLADINTRIKNLNLGD